MAWVDIEDGESMASVLAKINALGQSSGGSVSGSGHARYETTTGSVSTGVDTWTQLTNDILGTRTDTDHLPDAVTSLVDPATGELDFSELLEGDIVTIQVEFELTIGTNQTYAELRFQTEEAGPVTTDHIVQLGDMNKGTGLYSFAITHMIDVSDLNLLTQIPVEVRCSKTATLQPSALLIRVDR